MRFESERALQDWCIRVLESKGYRVQREVPVPGGLRADIVTGDAVYELKKVLTTGNLYRAKGQAMTYARHLGKRKIVLVGQLPKTGKERESALKLAETMEEAGFVTVSFVDIDPFWKEAKFNYAYVRVLLAGIVSFLLLLLMLPHLQRQHCRTEPQTPGCAQLRD